MCGACQLGCCAYCNLGDCDCYLNSKDETTRKIHSERERLDEIKKEINNKVNQMKRSGGLSYV